MANDASIQKDIETAVRILQEAGAQEVFIFGSVSHGNERPGSDLDLAVRGLPPEKFYETAGKVALSISREFDLIDLDEQNPFTEYLEKKGELRRVA